MGFSNSLTEKRSAFILAKERGKRSILSSGPNVLVKPSSSGASAIRAFVIALGVNKGKIAKVEGSSNKMSIVCYYCEYVSGGSLHSIITKLYIRVIIRNHL